MILTVLSRVLSAEDGQSLTDSCSDHKRVSCAQTVLVWLGQSKVLKVQSELTDIVGLLDGHLTGVSSVLSAWILRIHESGFVLVGCSATGELKVVEGRWSELVSGARALLVRCLVKVALTLKEQQVPYPLAQVPMLVPARREHSASARQVPDSWSGFEQAVFW